MADPKFKVVITGEAGGLVAAAAQGEAALKKMGGTAQSNAEVAEALKRIGNDAKGMAAETVAAAEKGKRFGGHLQEMKKIAGELSQEFPIAGLALKAFLNPIGAAAAISIGAFVAAKQAIADYLALFKELPNVTVTWQKKFEDFTKGIAEGAKAWRDYAKAYNDAMRPKETTASKADKDVEALKAKAAMDTGKLDRSSSLADEQDNLAVAQGRLTPAQAALRKAQRAESYGAAKDRIAAGVVSGERDIRAAEEKRLTDELPLKNAEAARAKAALDAAKLAEDDKVRKAAAEKQRAAETADAAKKASEDALPYEEPSAWDKVPVVNLVRYYMGKAAVGQARQLRGAVGQQNEALASAEGSAMAAHGATESASSTYTDATSDSVGTRAALTQVRGMLPGLQSAVRESTEANQVGAAIRVLQTSARVAEAQQAAIEAAQKRLSQLEARARQ